MIKRTILSITVALITASIVVIPALAASYYISEYSADFFGITLRTKNPCPSEWTCRDNNAKYWHLDQNGGAEGVWYAKQAGTTPRRMDWYTFIPNDNTSQVFGAVRYRIINPSNSPTENYPTVCNQNNWKGSAPYLGYLDRGNKTSYMFMPNYCVAGYSCNTSYPVYWDRSQFIW